MSPTMALQDQVETIDTEGGRHLENVDKDLAYLRKKISHEVRKAENAVIGLIAELEIKVDNLVDVFVTLECIHLYILCLVPRCLIQKVSIMYLSHFMPRCSYQ